MTEVQILEYLFDENEKFDIKEIPNIVVALDRTEWRIGHLCIKRKCKFCRLECIGDCKILIHNAIKYAIENKMSWLFV